ncbi:MAG TPA: hypothetical protein VNA18_05565 [Nitrososphaeraceae archaeon]|nr:hypothetical protein [Nitrososphaeraceae archaeon]
MSYNELNFLGFKTEVTDKGRRVMVKMHLTEKMELVYNVSLTSISEEIIVRKNTKKYRASHI